MHFPNPRLRAKTAEIDLPFFQQRVDVGLLNRMINCYAFVAPTKRTHPFAEWKMNVDTDATRFISLIK